MRLLIVAAILFTLLVLSLFVVLVVFSAVLSRGLFAFLEKVLDQKETSASIETPSAGGQRQPELSPRR